MALVSCKFHLPHTSTTKTPLSFFTTTNPRIPTPTHLCFFNTANNNNNNNNNKKPIHQYTSSITPIRASSEIPARDRVIDFGKYKGKMLGTLPSDYLRWVSQNLRARDFEEWAIMADQVLQDPLYRDRLEWECAEKVLKGDGLPTSSHKQLSSPLSALEEISERFGWDNEDKMGWSRVNFALLGTSKGAWIPRISKEEGRRRLELIEAVRKGKGVESGELGRRSGAVVSGRRVERRDRVRLKKSGGGVESRRSGELADELKRRRVKRILGSRDGDGEEVVNPFPGRDGLIKKVLSIKQRRGREV